MIILPTLSTSLIHVSLKVGRMYFLNLGVFTFILNDELPLIDEMPVD